MPEPFLRCSLRHRQGPLQLDVAFDLSAPWTVLFGPSGSGKSTILRALQGLLHPAHAEVLLHGQSLSGVPPHRRPIRSAAQSASLFPHLAVRDNLLWGATREAPVAEVLALFHIEHLAQNRPEHLSGGERQRVAVARAVLSASSCPGALLLLDEPFTGLDLALRDQLARDLRAWLAARGIPVLSVTHDITEPFLLEAEVLRLEDGRLIARGPAAEALAAERLRTLQNLQAP